MNVLHPLRVEALENVVTDYITSDTTKYRSMCYNAELDYQFHEALQRTGGAMY